MYGYSCETWCHERLLAPFSLDAASMRGVPGCFWDGLSLIGVWVEWGRRDMESVRGVNSRVTITLID